MTFHVGQKVVCVDDSPTTRSGRRELTLRTVYTVRWVGVEEVDLAIKVAEIPDRTRYAGLLESNTDLGFRATRFRPVIEKKTDISIFTEMLDDVRARKTLVTSGNE